MRSTLFVVTLATLLGCVAEPEAEPDYIYSTPYLIEDGGVQIIEVRPNFTFNKSRFGWEDELVILRSDTHTSLNGWQLQVGNSRFPISGHVGADSLYIYSRQARGIHSNEVSLGLGADLWSDRGPETIKLIDSGQNFIDNISYDFLGEG